MEERSAEKITDEDVKEEPEKCKKEEKGKNKKHIDTGAWNMEEKQEKSRIDRQFDFIREIDKEKFITRQTFLSDAKRRENDAEHAWHMAIMTLLLSEYANEEIDVLRVISMLLIHDLVEIDAGDTYAYDEEGKQTQRVREVKAADRIYGILPEDQEEKLRELWEEFGGGSNAGS